MDLLSQMLAIADANPHLLQAYRCDLTEHDANVLAATRAGDQLVWFLRQTGTDLIDRNEPLAGERFAAERILLVPDDQAYAITVHADGGAEGEVRWLGSAQAWIHTAVGAISKEQTFP